MPADESCPDLIHTDVPGKKNCLKEVLGKTVF